MDERSEIAGSFMGVPQNDVGIRTDVMDGCPKREGMMLLMRSMNPAVVAVDEIGGFEDMKAVFQILQCGSAVAATLHGNSAEDMKRHMAAGYSGKKEDAAYRPEELFERYVFMEKRQGKCRVREILNRDGERIYPGKEGGTCQNWQDVS